MVQMQILGLFIIGTDEAWIVAIFKIGQYTSLYLWQIVQEARLCAFNSGFSIRAYKIYDPYNFE